jgi:hypothetical protein
MKSLDEIHNLEKAEQYPEVIDSLEERLKKDPSDIETVIRLGFNLWYAAHENQRMQKQLPEGKYRKRFMELLRIYKRSLWNNPDFCWAYGLGLALFWYEFPDASEKIGKELINQACKLDPFWAAVKNQNATLAEMKKRLKGRGIFEVYYNLG